MTNISEMFNLVNRYTGEYTDERISNSDRLSAISESTSRIKQIMKGDMSNATYSIDFIPDVFYYKLDKGTYNILAAANLRVSANDHTGARYDVPLTASNAAKINEDVSRGFLNNTYALDRYDGDMYLVVAYQPNANRKVIPTYNTLSQIGLSGDALNLSIDNNESIKGNAIRFNVAYTAGQSSVLVDIEHPLDISDLRYTSSSVWSVWIDEPEGLDSIELRLKSGSSSYVLFTAIEPFNNSSFKQGWNRLVVPYAQALEVGNPDLTDINQYEVVLNYDSNFVYNTIRVDDLYIANPTKLNFHYLSYSVGRDINGNEITTFTSEDDIPYFAGQYDSFKYPIARYAASYLLFDLRRQEDALVQEREAKASLKEVMNLIPSQHTVETKSFRPSGVNFRKRRRFGVKYL